MGDIYSQVLNLTVIFNPWLFLAIFVIVLIAEFGLPVPYLMETIWLFSGYSLATGNIAIEHILLFCTVGVVGRLAGAIILFYISRYSKKFVTGIYRGYLQPRIDGVRPLQILFSSIHTVVRRITSGNSRPAVSRVDGHSPLSLFGRKCSLSPVTVAMGRFLWLRLPITIALSARKQRTVLILGVAIFSVIWDGAYIVFGVLGGKGGLDPLQMLLYPLGVMALISVAVFAFRRLRTSSQPVGYG